MLFSQILKTHVSLYERFYIPFYLKSEWVYITFKGVVSSL
jgi:hypothetical protein